MAFPFRNILCPLDFDENSTQALEMAGDIARQNDGTVFVLHIVPMIVPPVGVPGYVQLYECQRQTAAAKLEEIAHKGLSGLKYELIAEMGDPAHVILKTAARADADLVVMATHGRRGFSRFFLGSVAELVLRESNCPVLTVRYLPPEKHLVSGWMTCHPVTAAPSDKVSALHGKMVQSGFHAIPIVQDGIPVAIVTDHDIHACSESLESTVASMTMAQPLITVNPSTTLREAARLLCERKISALPVVEEGKLAGVITTTDILGAFIAEERPEES
jgi:nucleotide-binding universal stress UspA family protein/CBS domain-containing protein